MSGKLAIPPLPLVDGKLLVSPTQLDDMRRCFEYWGYRHVHKRVPSGPAPERDGGTAGHAGLYALWMARLRGADEATARQEMREAVEVAFRKIEMPEADSWRTPVRYNEALDGYLDHYGAEPFEVLGCEVAFSVPLGEVEVHWSTLIEPRFSELVAKEALGTATADEHAEMEKLDAMRDNDTHYLPIILRGIIDRVIRWDGIVRVGDYKFKNDWGDASQTQYERDPQFKLYALALREVQQSGERPDLGQPSDVTGSVIDAIILRKPLGDGRTSKLPRTEYRRVHYPYTLAQLEESRQMALAWVRMALQQHAEGRFVQNESRCSFFFGKRVCPYLQVCGMDEANRAMILASDYFRDKVEYMAAKEVEDAIE